MLVACVLEIPDAVVRESLGLRVDAECLVPRDDDVPRGIAPARCFLVVGAQGGRVPRVPRDGVRRSAEVPLRDEVCVDVVVGRAAYSSGPVMPSIRNLPSRS